MSMPADVDRDRAYRLGYLAGKGRLEMLSTCPYPAEQRLLRIVFARGYAAGKVDAEGPDWWEALKDRIRTWWHADEEGEG